MTYYDATVKRIVELMKEKKLSKKELAIRAGISYSTINSILTGKKTNFNLSTLMKICDGLGITLKYFFDTYELKRY